MISVISSYKIMSDVDIQPEQPFPLLPDVCRELKEHDFCAVDVLVTSRDIELCHEGSQSNAIDFPKTASRMAKAISGALSSGPGIPLEVPGFATNLPNISNIINETQWERAVNDLAICLLAADTVGTRVVEIVCGRRIAKVPGNEAQGTTVKITKPDDPAVLVRIRERFVQGVLEAFRRTKAVSGAQYPRVAVALEIEPDIVALANSLNEASELLTLLHARIGPAEAELTRHIGLNLDIGHLLVSLDRGDPERRETRMTDALHRLATLNVSFGGSNKGPVLHAHVGDHDKGAHWADAPVGQFRSDEEYAGLLGFYVSLLQDTPTQVDQRSDFFSGAIAIELEACNSIDKVLECRNAIYRIAPDIDTSSDRTQRLEHLIAKLPPDVRVGAWLEGVNLTLYRAIRSLTRQSKIRSGAREALFCEEDLPLFRQFLSARSHDKRTELAVEIAMKTFSRLGLSVLSSWFHDLLELEYDRAFYREYRDHTVHSVYVYLLGWLFYVRSPEVRSILQDRDIGQYQPDTLDWFSSCWPAVALCHDLGYVFESESQTHWEEALRKLTDYSDTFLAKAVLYGPTGRFLSLEQNEAVVDLIGRPDFGRCLSRPEDVANAVFFNLIKRETEHRTQLGEDELRKAFTLFSVQPPDGGRPLHSSRFYDHGIMAAALVHCLMDIRNQWAKYLQDKVHLLGASEDTEIKVSVEAFLNSISPIWSSNDNVAKVCAAIALHNIYPERRDTYPNGLLYSNATADKHGVSLDRFTIPAMHQPLAFLLALCDTLQDWGRYTFSNPLRVEKKALSWLEIDIDDGGPGERVSFRYPTRPAMADEKKDDLDYRFGHTWAPYVDFPAPRSP